MRATGVDGVDYVTVSEIRRTGGYDDVTAGNIRQWIDTGKLSPVTVAELAAALGYPVPVGVDGSAPARARGISGDENVFRWDEFVAVETATRLTRRRRGGRPRHATAGRKPPGP